MLEILLVDDEPSMLQMLGGALRAQGHSVAIASDGAEALEAASHHAFDALVCDVQMPNVDGLSVLEQMRSHWPQTPVILMSGQGGAKEEQSALHEGALDYLIKPIEMSRLLARLGQISPAKDSKPAKPVPDHPVPDHPERFVASEAVGPILPLYEAMARFEKHYLEQALSLNEGRKAATAELLGISRKSLWEKLKRHAVASTPANSDEELPPQE